MKQQLISMSCLTSLFWSCLRTHLTDNLFFKRPNQFRDRSKLCVSSTLLLFFTRVSSVSVGTGAGMDSEPMCFTGNRAELTGIDDDPIAAKREREQCRRVHRPLAHGFVRSASSVKCGSFRPGSPPPLPPHAAGEHCPRHLRTKHGRL